MYESNPVGFSPPTSEPGTARRCDLLPAIGSRMNRKIWHTQGTHVPRRVSMGGARHTEEPLYRTSCLQAAPGA